MTIITNGLTSKNIKLLCDEIREVGIVANILLPDCHELSGPESLLVVENIKEEIKRLQEFEFMYKELSK